jgi:hypothetical protein
MAFLGLTIFVYVRTLYPKYIEIFLMKLSYVKNKVPGQNCCGLLVIIVVPEIIDFGDKEKYGFRFKEVEPRGSYS